MILPELSLKMSSSTLLPGYSFLDAPPPLKTYLFLRKVNGLSPKSEVQGTGALSGSWAFCTVVYIPPVSASNDSRGGSESAFPEPEIVGMARLIGDGGWYFCVSDMAVLPLHRRKGLGEAMLRRLLAKIKKEAPGALVTLSADEPGRPLYKKIGFVESAPRSIGMWLELDKQDTGAQTNEPKEK
ncbi:hypothetical protein VKT23_006577 [Stygiomarasmius scandens]|uniref:N-acetyltransferase domain-containing protein n=1 Tax=Marasmiellus scandens TaxID=2682957 RepID=A0ABR1JN97_9AGAR